MSALKTLMYKLFNHAIVDRFGSITTDGDMEHIFYETPNSDFRYNCFYNTKYKTLTINTRKDVYFYDEKTTKWSVQLKNSDCECPCGQPDLNAMH
jgi:hypothetical protein